MPSRAVSKSPRQDQIRYFRPTMPERALKLLFPSPSTSALLRMSISEAERCRRSSSYDGEGLPDEFMSST